MAEGKAKKKIPPIADRLIYYVREAGWPLFVDQHAEAHTFVGGQAVPISRANRPLTRLLYDYEGRAPSNDGLIGARRVLDMLAHESGEVRELHTRAAFHEGAVFYELAPGRVVRVDEKGWKMDPDPPVYFRAVKNLKPLPDPVEGGKLEDITTWVNLKSPKDKRLFLTHITLTALAHVQRYILQATGVMGSGKSTASRVVKRLLDPTANEAVTIDKRNFLQKAAHCYVLVLDNQNYFPEWFQDTLCRLVTGESDSKRVLYTDEDDLIWSMMRAVVLNGINPPTDRSDVQDRTLPIELDRLPKEGRLPEDDFWMQFYLKQPELLGAIFTALSGALRERHNISLDEKPRLADWGLYAAALYKDQGWGVDQFVEDWETVEKNQQQGTLDGSIVAQVIISYMKTHDRVEQPAAKLHATLEDHAEDDFDLSRDKTWPKTGRTLWKRIREVTTLLEAHGIHAHRSTNNEIGRPIILDTDFDGDPDDDNKQTKSTDDTTDDNCTTDDTTNDNLFTSPGDTAHFQAETDDNAPDGRYSGTTLASVPSDPNEEIGDTSREQGQGESKPDLSSSSSDGSARPVSWDLDPGESATVEQLRRIRKLVHEGMSEKLAREEVLGKGVKKAFFEDGEKL